MFEFFGVIDISLFVFIFFKVIVKEKEENRLFQFFNGVNENYVFQRS